MPEQPPQVAEGGFCAPFDDALRPPPQRTVPADPSELAREWDAEATALRARAKAMPKRKVRRRMKAEADVWATAAFELRKCLRGGGPVTLADLLVVLPQPRKIHYYPWAQPTDAEEAPDGNT